MPAARKVVTRAPHRRVGLIACPWFQPNTIEYESLLERDFVRLALLDPDVSSISHQPFPESRRIRQLRAGLPLGQPDAKACC